MSLIPREQQVFPAWFAWMMLIPLAGYVFAWIMLPFGLPLSIKKLLPDHGEAAEASKILFVIGLVSVCLPLALAIPFTVILVIPARFILMIVYWVNVVKIRKFIQANTTEQSRKISQALIMAR